MMLNQDYSKLLWKPLLKNKRKSMIKSNNNNTLTNSTLKEIYQNIKINLLKYRRKIKKLNKIWYKYKKEIIIYLSKIEL